ncbi:MAG: hypothetical protein LUF92_00495 [Clostridiales bacterium]|nr:hypothetical protein [Clostridiales bacterium]
MPEVLFSDYCTSWLEQQKGKIRPASYAKYNVIVEKHIRPELGNCQLSELSIDLVEHLEKKKTLQEKLSARTVRSILIVLRSILDYIQKETGYDFSSIQMPYPPLRREKNRPCLLMSRSVFFNFWSLIWMTANLAYSCL